MKTTKNTDQDKTLQELRYLSDLLDNAIAIPGTDYRIGIDPILGLLPGIGDYLPIALSGYIIWKSARLGVSKSTLLRMLTNIIIDALVGTIPMLGDLFDFAWKANRNNLHLLESSLNSSQTRRKVDLWFVIFLLGGMLFLLMVLTIISVLILQFLWSIISK